MPKKMLNDNKVRDLITCDNVEGFEQLQFVRAGAGAGKTTSIKNRVLNLIKHKDLIPERMVTIGIFQDICRLNFYAAK
jgi:hypothetical protein